MELNINRVSTHMSAYSISSKIHVRLSISVVFLVSAILCGCASGGNSYNKTSEEFKEVKRQSKFGDVEAKYSLGEMYYKGEGVVQNYRKAARWYSLAAKRGHAKAQYSLGVMYYKGEAFEQDYKKAAKWYRKAALQEVAWAAYNLGEMYDKGEGVLQDKITANMWLLVAGVNGLKEARSRRGLIAKNVIAEEIEKSKERARNCVLSDYTNCD